VQISQNKHITLKLMVLLTLEEIWGDKEQFEFFELVEFKYPDLVLCLLICSQKSPFNFG